ncbi:Uncharacterised protein [Streptococcus suis]|uniref:Uncharacterized protein n=1 Tax=Streptococcus suis TaxID=1307 RepID=A0A0Z8GXM6_STRSU|nr:Uncharacterised protein [Streptococcus suis]
MSTIDKKSTSAANAVREVAIPPATQRETKKILPDFLFLNANQPAKPTKPTPAKVMTVEAAVPVFGRSFANGELVGVGGVTVPGSTGTVTTSPFSL